MKLADLPYEAPCGELDPSGDPPLVACALPAGHQGPHGFAVALTAVKVFCRNEQCRAKGSWIQRTVKHLEKTVYRCEACGQPMVR